MNWIRYNDNYHTLEDGDTEIASWVNDKLKTGRSGRYADLTEYEIKKLYERLHKMNNPEKTAPKKKQVTRSGRVRRAISI